MKRILLIRHCHAMGQHKDSPLSKQGNLQAYELANLLENLSFPIDRIITSPFFYVQRKPLNHLPIVLVYQLNVMKG